MTEQKEQKPMSNRLPKALFILKGYHRPIESVPAALSKHWQTYGLNVRVEDRVCPSIGYYKSEKDETREAQDQKQDRAAHNAKVGHWAGEEDSLRSVLLDQQKPKAKDPYDCQR